MRGVIGWLKEALRAIFWFLILAAVIIFSAGAFSQFIYTDF